jgi:hypothetical protein
MRHGWASRPLLRQTAVLAALLLGAGAWLIVDLQRPPSASDLQRSAGDLASFAAEGELLAQRIEQRDLPRNYAVHESRFVNDRVMSIRKSLAAVPGTEQLIEIAGLQRSAAAAISLQLRALAGAYESDHDARRAGDALHASAAELRAMKHRLSQ